MSCLKSMAMEDKTLDTSLYVLRKKYLTSVDKLCEIVTNIILAVDAA